MLLLPHFRKTTCLANEFLTLSPEIFSFKLKIFQFKWALKALAQQL